MTSHLAAQIARDTSCPVDLAAKVARRLVAYTAALDVLGDLAGTPRERAARIVLRTCRAGYERLAAQVARLVTPPPVCNLPAKWLADALEVLQ